MIHEVEIRNFGCIRKATVRLTRLHAFVGPNGAGKSMLFKALGLLSEICPGWASCELRYFAEVDPASLLARVDGSTIEVTAAPAGSPFHRRVHYSGEPVPIRCHRIDAARGSYDERPGSDGASVLSRLEAMPIETDLVLIEHPENYLYPGAIAPMVDRLRGLSDRAQVLVTTHSPLVLNEMHPEQVTIVRRDSGAVGTAFKPITQTKNFEDRARVYALGELWLSYLDTL
jgi:predicted ATPase